MDLKEKLITITGNNASNNKTMASELFYLLSKTCLDKKKIQFKGLNSYICCLAYILNLIVKDILQALRCSTSNKASTICDKI